MLLSLTFFLFIDLIYYMKMIAKVKNFVKRYEHEIVLFMAIFLITMLAFSLGYNFAKEQFKKPIKIEQIDYEY